LPVDLKDKSNVIALAANLFYVRALSLLFAAGLSAPGLSHAAPVRTGIPPRDFHAVLDLESRLALGDSASVTLGRWCADRHLADPPVIRAVREERIDRAAGPETLRQLDARPGEQVTYRKVKLLCGRRVLSEAENWYRPAVLTPEMNRELQTTQKPFGLVVAPLGFHRRTLSIHWLVRPARQPGIGAGQSPAVRYELLRHVAVLSTSRGVPFSVVVETYTSDVLAAPAEAAAVSR
jgi:hypothetical protein